MDYWVKQKFCLYLQPSCRISTSVVHWLPKPRRRVRLPYPAPFDAPESPRHFFVPLFQKNDYIAS